MLAPSALNSCFRTDIEKVPKSESVLDWVPASCKLALDQLLKGIAGE